VFSHANQVKNVLAQFAVAAGTGVATLFIQWRTSLHYTRLGESLAAPESSRSRTSCVRSPQRYGATHGCGKRRADGHGHRQQPAVAAIALSWRSSDYFVGVAGVAGCAWLVALAERAWRRGRLRARRPERLARAPGER
jgi:DHA2 family multidrug resistance protein